MSYFCRCPTFADLCDDDFNCLTLEEKEKDKEFGLYRNQKKTLRGMLLAKLLPQCVNDSSQNTKTSHEEVL